MDKEQTDECQWNDDWNAELAACCLHDPPCGFAEKVTKRFETARHWRKIHAAFGLGALCVLSSAALTWVALFHFKVLTMAFAASVEGIRTLAAVVLLLWQAGPFAGMVTMIGLWGLFFAVAALLSRIFHRLSGAEITPGIARIHPQKV